MTGDSSESPVSLCRPGPSPYTYRVRGRPGCIAIALGLSLLVLAGCPQYGVIDDGTSVSYGPSNQGALIKPTRLPRSGDGYWIPRQWSYRGLNYGTDEMVSTIVHAGRRVVAEFPGSRFGVADISLASGGPSAWHRSHQTGRDVDILFFATDPDGRPVELSRMVHFQEDGVAREDSSLHFDVARNWALVRALLENPIAEIQYMFIYDPLKQMMLDHARTTGEPDHIIAYASYILHQPSDSLPHNDHIHLRIYCSRADRSAGCRDRGVLRWTKKDYKYDRDRSVAGAAAPAATALLEEMPALLVITGGRVFR